MTTVLYLPHFKIALIINPSGWKATDGMCTRNQLSKGHGTQSLIETATNITSADLYHTPAHGSMHA